MNLFHLLIYKYPFITLGLAMFEMSVLPVYSTNTWHASVQVLKNKMVLIEELPEEIAMYVVINLNPY